MSEQSHIAEVAADLAKAAELHMPAMVIMVHQLRAVYDHADALEVRATAAEARKAKLREALNWYASDPLFGNVARAALETDNG